MVKISFIDTNFLAVLLIITIIIISGLYFVFPRTSLKDNEHNAFLIVNLHISGALFSFRTDEGGFARTWKELHDDPIAEDKYPYLHIDLSEPIDGYKFTLEPAGDKLTGTSGTTVYTDFICIAEPVRYGRDGNKSYYLDSDGIVRVETGKTASKNSSPVGPDTNYRRSGPVDYI